MAAAPRLELRDLEILRALLRVRYLTTRSINNAFFSCPRIGRRRIHRLSEYDLIRSHTKGLPAELHYRAWRLTTRGLDAVGHAFPDEPIPDGFVDRASSGSLHHALHREALSDLYLAFTVPARVSMSERDLKAHRRWIIDARRRANAITWAADGEIVLSVSVLGERTDVVPDASVRSSALGREVFIELDRSTKDLGRIRDSLLRYRTVFRHLDFGDDTPTLLFVVRSEARRTNIQKIVDEVTLAPASALVLREEGALEWLRLELLSVSTPASPPRRSALYSDARRAYSWFAKLQGVMDANGMRRALAAAEPAFMQEGHERFTALYKTLKAFEEEGASE